MYNPKTNNGLPSSIHHVLEMMTCCEDSVPKDEDVESVCKRSSSVPKNRFGCCDLDVTNSREIDHAVQQLDLVVAELQRTL